MVWNNGELVEDEDMRFELRDEETLGRARERIKWHLVWISRLV